MVTSQIYTTALCFDYVSFRLCLDFQSQRPFVLSNSAALGKLAEQFVARHSSDLFYWSREARGSTAEVDFLIAREGNVVPVEVKSGSGGSLRSLHLLLATYPSCPEGIVLCSGPFAHRPEQRLTFMPLYAAGSLGDPPPDVA